MKRSLQNIVFYILLAMSLPASGQVTVNFNTSLFGRSLDGLSFAQLMNASPQLVFAKIRITIREIKTGTVATVHIPYMQLRPGINSINNQNFTRSSIVFA